MPHTIATRQHARRDAWGWVQGFGWEVSLLLEPRDLWVGVYWTWETTGMLSVYVCLLPCLPIRVILWGLR